MRIGAVGELGKYDLRGLVPKWSAIAGLSERRHMIEHFPDEQARDRRLAAIRAQRGTPERETQIQALELARATAAKSKARATSTSGRKTPENSSEMFGHPWTEWFQMRDAGFDHIERCARKRSLTTYAELWSAIATQLGKDLGSHWRQLPNLLGYISEWAYEKYKLIPTALVIDQEGDAHPGPGFFRLAAMLGALPENDSPPTGEEWTGMTDSQREFWEASRDAVFNHFAQ